MNIENFKNIPVITDGYVPFEAMLKVFNYCIPLWRNWHQSAGVRVTK